MQLDSAVIYFLIFFSLPSLAFDYWVADSLDKIFPETPAPELSVKTIGFDAARNEVETAQVVLRSHTSEPVVVTLLPLVGPLGKKLDVQVREVGYVPVDHNTPKTPPQSLVAKITEPPQDFPDPLLNLEKNTLKLTPHRNHALWLTLSVADNVPPGKFEGQLVLKGSVGSATIPVSARVRKAAVPLQRNLFLANWITYDKLKDFYQVELWSERYWAILKKYAEFMALYRHNVIRLPLFPLVSATAASSSDFSNLSFDFSRLDQWVETFEKAGVRGLIEGDPIAGRKEWGAKEFYALFPTIRLKNGSLVSPPDVTTDSKTALGFYAQFFPALKKHLEEKGWWGHYVQHLADEPLEASSESYRKLAQSVKSAAPGVKIIEAIMTTNLVGAVDIWVPLSTQLHAAKKFYDSRRALGERVWFYTCLIPQGGSLNRFIDYPLLSTRLTHWANIQYETEGFLHWGLNYWPRNPWRDVEYAFGKDTPLPPGDSHIIYPGKEGPLSSIRMETLRDGVEDFELLKLLESKNSAASRELVNEAVRTFDDFIKVQSKFHDLRARLLNSLE